MKFFFKIIVFCFITSGCHDEPVLSLADKYEAITEFQSIVEFPYQINESSGLAYESNRLWTHNDGGDSPNLYQIDISSGTILSTLNIQDAQNNDWEDISDDSLYFYIADIGNNRGNRQDLNILKLLKPTLNTDTSYTASRINFTYGQF